MGSARVSDKRLIMQSKNACVLGSFVCLFLFRAIKIFALYVYIDVEVDENEEASTVCN